MFREFGPSFNHFSDEEGEPYGGREIREIAYRVWQEDYRDKVSWALIEKALQNTYFCRNTEEYFDILEKKAHRKLNRVWKTGFAFRMSSKQAFLKCIGRQNGVGPLFILYVYKGLNKSEAVEHEVRHLLDRESHTFNMRAGGYRAIAIGQEVLNTVQKSTLLGWLTLVGSTEAMIHMLNMRTETPVFSDQVKFALFATTAVSTFALRKLSSLYLQTPAEQSVRTRM